MNHVARPAAPERVLVVEDEYLIARDIVHMLGRLGFAILGPCRNAEAALALLDQHSDALPDMAFLDIDLRGQTVFPFAEELQRRGVPFVFCSGYDARMVPEEMQGVRLLSKPFTTGELIAALSCIRGG